MDTKFSVAIHILILIARSEKPMSSEQLAQSAGTNASYVRKIAALLKKANIIESRRGVGGFGLRVPEQQLSLYAIYCAVNEKSGAQLFDIHQNPNDRCIVGRHIQPVLAAEFATVEQALNDALQQKTLADCILEIQEREKDYESSRIK